MFIEESLYRGTQSVVFEPNDEPLWAQIRLNIGAFMQNLFRQGAFQDKSPREAYLVKCDAETTTQNDINLGIVNILVGFAPLKPAEFAIIRIHQLAGEVQTYGATMARLTVNAERFDPYKNFKFRVFCEESNTPVAGVSKVSSLERSTEVVEHREGGRSEQLAQVTRTYQARACDAGAQRYTRPRVRGVGEQVPHPNSSE